MHRSRIGIFLIDHPEDAYDEALAFWAAATGREAVQEPGLPYASAGGIGPVNLEIQRTGEGTPARIHIDFETDDVPAEVERLTRLGATVTEDRGSFTVMRDPGGLVFCVVSVQTGQDRFDAAATTWQ